MGYMLSHVITLQARSLVDQVRPDADSVSAAQDSASVIQEFGRGLERVVTLVFQGEWEQAGELLWARTTSGIARFIPDLLLAFLVGLIGFLIYRTVFRLTDRLLRGSERISSGFRDLLLNLLRVSGIGLLAILVLAQLGLDVTAALAGLGILGLALGFAAKDSLENFLAGVTILMDRPFRVGDMVEVDGSYGTVTRFTLRSTRIRTLRNRIVVMPNVSMINQKLINHSALRYIRVDIQFGIAYKEDIARAREVVLATVGKDDRLASDPPPRVVVVQLNDSSVDLELRLAGCNAREEQRIRMDYLERIRVALGEADIEIPFPHMQLFIDGAAGLERVLGEPRDTPGS